MKFNILYYSLSAFKVAAIITLCLSINILNAQNTCGNSAGEARSDIFVCSGNLALGNAEEINRGDNNAAVHYYLHNNDINNPIDANSTGFFDNNGNYPTNTDLLITAVVGPPNQAGLPILNDACTDIQDPGTKVVFLDDISIRTDFDCIGTNAEISFIVNGGLPAYNGSSYSITGDVINTVPENTNNVFGSFGASGSYTIEAEDNNNCKYTKTDQYVCEIEENIDLALTKKLAPGQPSTITAGNNITFQIEVINQGNVPLQNIRLVDYIPVGLTLADNSWTMAAGSNPQITLPGILAPQTSISINITLMSLPTAFATTMLLENAAEIVYAEKTDNTSVNNDIDGAFDSNDNNDGVPVNDATNNPNDEDDHDIEDFIIELLIDCTSIAGTMPSDTVFACFDEEVTVTERNSIIDNNRDVAIYVLHDNPGNVINNIIATSSDGKFTNPGTTDCRAYYVSYIFGPNSGDGTPNLLSDCTTVLLGTPVIWLNQITISSIATCINDGSNFTVNYNINGGYPACSNDTYTVGGSFSNNGVMPSLDIEDPKVFNNNDSYNISVKDIEGCATTNSFGPIVCATADPCSNTIAGTMPADTIFACANSTKSSLEEGSILGDLLGFYYLHDNSDDLLGTIYSKSANGEFGDPGNVCKVFYISYAIGPDNGNGEPNLLDDCAYVLPGTPIIWASPIVFETEEVCDNDTGMFTFNLNVNGGFAQCLDSQYDLYGDTNVTIAEAGQNYVNNNPFPNNSSYSFTATDEKGCTNNYSSNPITCEMMSGCGNVAGRMDQNIEYVCFEEPATITPQSNSQLNDNDVANYVLHEGDSFVLVNIISTSVNNVFDYPGGIYDCVTLYVSYVFGPNDGNGRPDLSSDCTKVLKGTPVIWSAPIKIRTTETCNEETEQFQFTYFLTGGFPSCIGSEYAVTGDVTVNTAIPDDFITEPTFYDNNFAYTIDVTDGKGCNNSFRSDPIVCVNQNPCSNSVTGDFDVGEIPSLCENETIDLYTFSPNIELITGNFVDEGDVEGFILYLGEPIDTNNIEPIDTSNIISINTNGVFSDPGIRCAGLRVTYIIAPDDGTGLPDVNSPCAKFSDSVPIVWFPKVNISSTANCDETTGNLVVNFNVSGGPSACGGVDFVIEISGVNDTLVRPAGNHTIPVQLNSSQPYQITATDEVIGCSSTFTSEQINCDIPDPFCGNVLGTMQFVNQRRVCAGSRATAKQEDTILGDGSIGNFYLHTNSNNTLGSIIANNSSGVFDDPGTDYACDTLYISYVLGPNNGNNEIDLTSDCTFVLTGAPVIWASPIKILTNEVCDANAMYKINYELSGGFPDCLGSIFYNVNGNINNTAFSETGLSPGSDFTDDSYLSGTTYELNVTDDIGCKGNYIRNGDVFCPSLCFNQAGTAHQSAKNVCFNDEVDGSVDDTIVDVDYDIVYILHDGVNSIGNQYACNLTGIFKNDATLGPNGIGIPINRQLYISSVVSILDSEGKPNFDAMCTEVMLPGTPVVFLSETQVDVNIQCNDITEEASIVLSPIGGLPEFINNNSTFYHYILNSDTVASLRYGSEYQLNNVLTNYEIIIADDNNCAITVGGPTNCGDCLNQLGGQTQNAVTICGDESIDGVEVDMANTNIVDDAELIYILHDGENVVGEILDKNTTGVFINSGQYPQDEQLYVSAVIGLLNDLGLPDFDEPCTIGNFPGSPVIFSTKIELLDSSDDCPGDSIIIVRFAINGGNQPYTITGDYEVVLDEERIGEFTLPYGTENYTLTITDNNSCEEIFVRPISENCIKNVCENFNNKAGIMPSNDRYLCHQDSISITATGVIVDDGYSHFYVLHDDINSLVGYTAFNTTGDFINNGDFEANKQYYISSVVTTTTPSNRPNITDPCLSVSIKPAPVIFYKPITIEIIDEICNENTGYYTVKYMFSGGLPSFDNSQFYVSDGIVAGTSIAVDYEVESAPTNLPRYIITAKDSLGCNATFEKNDVVCVGSACSQFTTQNIANVISPNGDSVNDSWVLSGLGACYPNHRITICNRWGDKVYEVENCSDDNCWDGNTSKNGEALPTGAYYYIIELRGVNSTEDEIVTGSITILR